MWTTRQEFLNNADNDPCECRERLTNATLPRPNPHLFCKPDGGTHMVRSNAMHDFESFALRTWEELVQLEKGHFGTSASAIFCRLDIGVMMKGETISYFVNEVERSMTTSLWMSAMPDAIHGTLADTLAEALHRWIIGSRDPRHV